MGGAGKSAAVTPISSRDGTHSRASEGRRGSEVASRTGLPCKLHCETKSKGPRTLASPSQKQLVGGHFFTTPVIALKSPAGLPASHPVQAAMKLV